MDPRFTSWLTHSQYRRKHDNLAREYVAYRPPVEHIWPRISRAMRHSLSTIFLHLGERLSDAPAPTKPSVEIDPVGRTL